MDSTATYPARVDARLDPSLSRWLRLVKPDDRHVPPFRPDMGGTEAG